MPLTAVQKREVDEAFGLFDYAKTGVLDLHEVKVRTCVIDQSRWIVESKRGLQQRCVV